MEKDTQQNLRQARSPVDPDRFISVQKSKERIDVTGKLNGEAVYVDDIVMEGMQYAYGLTPKHVFAYVKNIDTSAAEKAEGVSCVVTWRDIPGDILMGEDKQDQYIFVKDRVLTTGDILALIVADTPEHAKAAASLVTVEYNPQKAMTDCRSAAGSSVVINPYRPDNLCSACFIRKGEPEADRPDDEVTVRARYETTWQEHAYIETEGVVAYPGAKGQEVTIIGGLQGLYNAVVDINRSLLIPMNEITTKACTIGGSFGGKLESTEVMAVRAAAAALKCRKPVKYILTREESMQQTHKRHPFIFDTCFSADRDGHFTRMLWDSEADGGPYANMTPGVIFKAVSLGAGPYNVPNVKLSCRGYYTNNITSGSMRGFGNPQGIYARECTIDELAEALRMSPYQLRKRNVMHRGDRTGSGQLIDFEEIGAEAVLDKVAESLDFDRKYARYRQENPGRTIRRGVGLSLSYRGNSYGTGVPDIGRCFLKVEADGTALLMIGMTELGQGLQTVMIQMAAEALGISDDQVNISEATSKAPVTGICNASRGTFIGGRAILDAAAHIHDCIRDALIRHFNSPCRSISFVDNNVIFNEHCLTFREAISITYAQGMTPASAGSYKTPDPVFNEQTGEGDTFYEYTYSCIGVEVEVDICTGSVKVIKTAAAHDPGLVINPKLAAGQAIGGAVMAQGYALTEDIRSIGGIATHTNFDSYLIPNIMDVPDEIDAMFVENPNDRGPFGARSLGEPSLDPGLGAYINAVNCALGELGKVRCNPVNLKNILFSTRHQGGPSS